MAAELWFRKSQVSDLREPGEQFEKQPRKEDMAQGVIDAKLLGKNVREFRGRDVDWPGRSFE
eukprot:3719779-Pyramimonas_sp.AAC.1